MVNREWEEQINSNGKTRNRNKRQVGGESGQEATGSDLKHGNKALT